MFSKTLPFFFKRSNHNASDLKYLNSFGIKNDYFDIIKDKTKNFSPISLNQETLCLSCKAFFSSDFISNSFPKQWICPFCLSENQTPEDFPSKLSSNFYYQKPKGHNDWEKELLFVICVDYSGSMNCDYYSKMEKQEIINLLNQGKTMDFIEETRLISRKNLILQALDTFFEKLLQNSQIFNIKVFMILFNNEVQLLGDCKENPIIIAKEELEDVKICFDKGKANADKMCSKFDGQTKIRIMKTLRSIEANCSTALGPAVAAGLGIIEKIGLKNNFIFVLTDGKSNIGCGDLDQDDIKNENLKKKAKEQADRDYEDMNEIALKYYIPFHFISFEDERTNLQVYKNKLLKRMNGNLFQIKVTTEKIRNKDMKFYDELDLDTYLEKVFNNAFNGKLFQLSIYQMPGCELQLFKRRAVHQNRSLICDGKNYILKKKPCYSEGELYNCVFSEYKPEFEGNKKIFFQIRLEFFSLTDVNTEIFISTFETHFFQAEENSDDLKLFM